MIAMFYGVPGSGKTSLCAYLAQRNKRMKLKYFKKINHHKIYSKLYRWLKKINDECYNILTSRKVYLMKKFFKKVKFKQKLWLMFVIIKCNFVNIIFNIFFKKKYYEVVYCTDKTVKDTVYLDFDILGKFNPYPNSLMLIDEAGCLADNRQWKTMGKEKKEFFAKHRHYLTDLCFLSQTADIDKSARNRAEVVYHMTPLGPFTVLRRIKYQVDVNESHDLADMYDKIPPLHFIFELIGSMRRKMRKSKVRWKRSFFVFRPFYYKYFDSYVADMVFTEPDPYLAYLEEQNKKEQIDNDEFQKY